MEKQADNFKDHPSLTQFPSHITGKDKTELVFTETDSGQTDRRETNIRLRLRLGSRLHLINDPFNSKIFSNQSGEIFPVIFY